MVATVERVGMGQGKAARVAFRLCARVLGTCPVVGLWGENEPMVVGEWRWLGRRVNELVAIGWDRVVVVGDILLEFATCILRLCGVGE